jgi:hypothetical protein
VKNILGLNTRVSHFNNEINRACTFCKDGPGANPDETFEHLFFSCTHTGTCINTFLQKCAPDLAFGDLVDKKKKNFMGLNPETGKHDNFFISTLAINIMRYIWECKLQKNRPMAESLANDIFFNIEGIRRASSTLRMSMNLNLSLCRNWTAEVARRH